VNGDEQDDQFVVSEKQLQGISILVVEDNPFNIMVAQSLLERSGATVDVAINGEEALNKIQPDKYHLVLMDLNMPVMDGFEATRRLRARGVTLPVIALTASLPAEVEKDVQSAGLTDIVVKPFNP
jgi:CheY-like chemotaxis protein